MLVCDFESLGFVNLTACDFENSGFVKQAADRKRPDIATPAREKEEAMPALLF
jgi:hypothetical protein